jgi:hypothetical protein
MSTTTRGPMQSGTVIDANSNVGQATLSQTVEFSSTSTSATNQTLYLPSGSQIVDIIADVTVAFNGTSTVATVGSAAGGTQYAGSIALTATGRVRPTFTAAQLAAMDVLAADSGSKSSSVIISTTPGSGNNTGTVRFTILYVQKNNTTDSI